MSQPAPGVGDPTNEADLDQTGRFVIQPNGRVRPLSPHLQIWRWHITMAASILFRVTIGAASFGAIIVLAWIAALASGPEAFARAAEWAGSPLGLLVGFGLTAVLFSFILNGARHLIQDTGSALTLKSADLLSHISIWGALVLAVLFWAALFASGRVSL
ncbi:MAG: succinate dehydrogenase, cytochrome b556 subunit [Brevundimonas sp.]|uniref:succinate dehydrogenase, cytochrome b556 subunit n=1 Tax=Brevundimonas sp. TaxID=1871086 RepID=UPI0025BCF439|nr:succinate dehydrogenase, cytochrome b556 subunit [Brevundimonas sp.]MBX3477954.1 succinate dehydrogenase, cytochrome b556 subunit [Brevundimonas sp.]